MFESHVRRWDLVPDGPAIATRTAHLLPVRWAGAPAMLKLSHDPEERRGGALMVWWNGEGAARVLARDAHAVLLERATGPGALADMARQGQDDAACRILCGVAAQLHASHAPHAPRAGPLPELVPLAQWFRDLAPAAARHGGVLQRSAQAMRLLLADPRETGVLHGDLHHGNVLDFGARGWLAIDPKGLFGERGFDFANIFTNPDLADPSRPVATEPGRFTRRLDVVAQAAGLERQRLLLWILAWAGLSASWFLADGDAHAAIGLQTAALAAGALGW
ncbi:MAG TPA: aminoglycoside phosphotransferase family protein [Pseudorhodoferax sp.]|nr:aminoglycoside phosphotransferase family protein [Pseudorhodoferax sp.]